MARARIGGFLGAIVSLIPAIWIEPFPFGLFVGCAALGAVVGYTVERNRGR